MVSSSVRADESGLTPAAPVALGGPASQAPETGLPIGPFLVYPEMTLGGVYNDNLYPAAAARRPSFGYRLAPAIRAVDDDGLRKTSLYFNADAELYPGAGPSVPLADRIAVSIAAGVDQSWAPTPDLSLQASVGYARQNALLPSQTGATTGFAAAPSVLNLTNGAQYSDGLDARASIEKTFGQGFFVRAGAGLDEIAYETGGAAPSEPPSARDLSGSLRVGYALTPQVSGFVEGDVDLQSRGGATGDSNIYRGLAGLSSDLLSLFHGEIYGGYQRQTSPRGAFAASAAPTFGGRLSYYPTAYLTLSASLDQTFAFTTGLNLSAPAANPDVLQARLEANYALAAYWRASASLGWARTTLPVPAASRVTAWIAAGRFDYNFWRSLDVTLEYQFSELDAKGGSVRGYDQNLTTLGLTYKY